MELFLTSSVHAVAHDIANNVDLSRADKLVFITTAAEPKEEGDLAWMYNDRQALVDAGFNVSDYTITGKSREQLEHGLATFDYIYMSGGNTAYLLRRSQESGFFSFVQELVRTQRKVYIGTSAGSMIAGPKLPEYLLDEGIDLEDRTGYGLVNFTLIPHWGSDHFKDRYLGGRLKILYTEDQVPLLLLTDNQYVHVKDDQMKIVDVKG